MNSDRPIRVMLSLADALVRDRCEQALAGEKFLIVGDAPDVIIAGGDDAVAADCPVAIQIGTGQVLASDFTDRELRLACQLAAELTAAWRTLIEARQTQRQLQSEAETDPLTGLANRRGWEAALERAAMSDETLVMAIFDLDDFKAINSEHGYATGDRVLRQVGQAIASAIRSSDFAARFGGDEFGILLPGLAAEVAETVVERIRLAIGNSTGDPAVTASAGFAIASSAEVESLDLFTAADRALIAAKTSGGDQTIG